MNEETIWGFIGQLKSGKLEMTDIGVKSIELSKDGSAMVVDGREVTALCYFCRIAGSFEIPSKSRFVRNIISNKPEKWSLIYGGTQRQPKRFFICEGCIKKIVHSPRTR